ncbi:EthD domain-containing protein [Pseudonocardia parietis]|uniref:Uncharacterized protein (TIGR02118 family) n=1 Tax=Pseudonocardia parietis TaxID=570936 RepID=A0ABS4VQK1_9PSEU|nr:EthD domain-containing protein [Pseudonocardia parietis]MBP2366201.1 uncharacterized protein (TIGR02118 family) [Pseudonocardia parietis]
MITRFGLAPRRDGLTVAQFQEHWRERHGPIIGVLPGLRRYWQNHTITGEQPWPGFDACSEMDADDVAAFEAVFAHPHYLDAGRADEQRFVDRSHGGAVLTRRLGARPAGRPAPVRLLTFLRAAPGCGPDPLATVLGRPGRGGGAVAAEAFVAVDGQPDPVFDAVEALWFADVAAARSYVCSPAAEDDRAALGRLVRGTERLVVTVHVVRRPDPVHPG